MLKIWGSLSAPLQRHLSCLLAYLLSTSLSRYWIPIYCKWQYRDTQYLKQFVPGSGAAKYRSFQDFFTRKLAAPLIILSQFAWPCEGLLCEVGSLEEISEVHIKGQTRHVRTIFGTGGEFIDSHYFFANIFLHNTNYHRVHAPVSGTVARIEHILGNLEFLRPWAYAEHPSSPALVNERINVDVISTTGDRWFLSLVGGPLVGSIRLAPTVGIGKSIKIGEELGEFWMGSTCCFAAPILLNIKAGTLVNVGAPMPTLKAFKIVA